MEILNSRDAVILHLNSFVKNTIRRENLKDKFDECLKEGKSLPEFSIIKDMRDYLLVVLNTWNMQSVVTADNKTDFINSVFLCQEAQLILENSLAL